jgi:hypothetical protein
MIYRAMITLLIMLSAVLNVQTDAQASDSNQAPVADMSPEDSLRYVARTIKRGDSYTTSRRMAALAFLQQKDGKAAILQLEQIKTQKPQTSS